MIYDQRIPHFRIFCNLYSIEGTKIHIYIDTKSYDKTKPLQSSKSKAYSNTSEASDELRSDDAKLSGDFEDSVVDVTMTRFLYSLDEINENEEHNLFTIYYKFARILGILH